MGPQAELGFPKLLESADVKADGFPQEDTPLVPPTRTVGSWGQLCQRRLGTWCLASDLRSLVCFKWNKEEFEKRRVAANVEMLELRCYSSLSPDLDLKGLSRCFLNVQTNGSLQLIWVGAWYQEMF